MKEMVNLNVRWKISWKKDKSICNYHCYDYGSNNTKRDYESDLFYSPYIHIGSYFDGWKNTF